MHPSSLRLNGNNNGTKRCQRRSTNAMSRLLLSDNSGLNRRQRRDRSAMSRLLNGGVPPSSARVNRLVVRRLLHLLSTKNLRLRNKGASRMKTAANKRMGNNRGDNRRITV